MVSLMPKKPLNFKNLSISNRTGMHGLSRKWTVITTLVRKLNLFNSF